MNTVNTRAILGLTTCMLAACAMEAEPADTGVKDAQETAISGPARPKIVVSFPGTKERHMSVFIVSVEGVNTVVALHAYPSFPGEVACAMNIPVSNQCTMVICQPEQNDTPPGPPPAPLMEPFDAGTLSVFVNGEPKAELELGSDSEIHELNLEESWFSTGDEIRVHISGSREYAPFETVLVAPGSRTLLTPDIEKMEEIDREKDLKFTWQGAPEGNLHVSLDVPRGSIDCQFDGALGQATIPARVLRFIPKGSDGRISVYDSSEAVRYKSRGLTLTELTNVAVDTSFASVSKEVVWR